MNRTYIFECYSDEKGCGNIWEIEASMDEISSLKPACPFCKKRKPVARNYKYQNTIIYDAAPKTLGQLADKNAQRMSQDHKQSITVKNNAYKNQRFTGKLPEGASLYPVDASGKKIASQTQKQKDTKRARI